MENELKILLAEETEVPVNEMTENKSYIRE